MSELGVKEKLAHLAAQGVEAAPRQSLQRAVEPSLHRTVARRTLVLGLAAGGTAAMVGCSLRPAQAKVALPSVAGSKVPAPARQEGPGPDDPVVAAIQDVVNRRAAALAAADRDAFNATIDQRNLTFRRIQGDTFAQAAANGPKAPSTYTVARVQAKQDPYYKAWIDVTPPDASSPQSEVVWAFRPGDNGWLHTEILNEEIGNRKTMDTDHFRLSYYDWDADVVDRMGAVAERANAKASDKLGYSPAFLTILSCNPTYASHSGLSGMGTQAAYLSDTKNTIIMHSIESFGAGATPIGSTPEDVLFPTLTHEYTHLVNDQLVPIVKMKKWMSEGLAEYVAENLRVNQVVAALKAGRQFTLDKAEEAIFWTTDPAKGYTNADVSLAYGEAAHAVTYFVERFTFDKFMELARAYAENQRWEPVFLQVVGIEWGRFQTDWLDWVRRRYGL